MRNRRGTAVAALVLPGDNRVVPASVALDEAIAIFGIDIATEFLVALFGSKLPKDFPEARNCGNRESAFDQANGKPASNIARCNNRWQWIKYLHK